jgi:thiol-disulfide isomerase/thioredoxin
VSIVPFAIPFAPLIFLTSVTFALISARIVSAGAGVADAALLRSVLVALVVSRLWFVGAYLPAYRSHWINAFDIRDLGFAPLPGVVTGVVVLLWLLARRTYIRQPVIIGAIVGALCWSTASTAAWLFAPKGTLPQAPLIDMSGHAHTLARTDGKPLVVNLWASWCGPCRAEMPMLVQAQREMPAIDFAFVNQGESMEVVKDFLAGQSLPADNVMLDPRMSLAMAAHTHGFPTTLFYDSRGRLLEVHLGLLSRATLQHTLDIAQTTEPGPAQASEH